MKQETICSSDNAQFAVRIYQQALSSAPVILCFPAMGVAASYYDPFSSELHSAGFNVVFADLRGVGSSSVRTSSKVCFGHKEMVEYDWPAAISFVKNKFKNNKLFLLGHSLGGQLNALYLSNNVDSVDGIILVAAGSVYYKSYPFPHNLKVLFGTQMCAMVACIFGYFPGEKIGFAGNESKDVIKDWAHQARTGNYKLKNSSINYEELMATVKKPILAISVENDLLAPPSAIRHLCSKFKEAAKEATIDEWHYRPRDPKVSINHFKWIKHSEQITLKIAQWISK